MQLLRPVIVAIVVTGLRYASIGTNFFCGCRSGLAEVDYTQRDTNTVGVNIDRTLYD